MSRTRIALAVIGVAAVGSQCIRPARTNPPVDPAASIVAHVSVPSDAAAILDRACRDCHSSDTRWPWYSQVAPVSWWVIEHVNHGRSHFNYSTWGSYDRDRQRSLLEQSCTLARAHDMPLGSYLLMHRSARLSAEDVETLCRWTQQALR